MTLATDYTPWLPQPPTAAIGRVVSEDRCAASAAAPAKAWVYQEAAVGFVLEGWFEYASEGEAVLAAPGSVVFGNAGEGFKVRHLDDEGNRRLVVSLKSDLLEEVANACDLDDARFRVIALAPGKAATRLFAWMRRASFDTEDDVLYQLTCEALEATRPRGPAPVGARQRRRIEAAVSYIEARFDEACTLNILADAAGLSRCHFVRSFATVVGQTPTQYLINTRLRAAADRLLRETTPIAELALDVGFNDISHFYGSFRAVFGCTPRQWRKRAS